MKKFLALLLAAMMVMALMAGCGSNNNANNNSAKSADDIADEMTSENGKYEIAFVTDVGQLKDKSFNQGTYDGVKLYANANGKTYKYYQPANGDQATDDDRYDAMKAAVDNGATTVVCAGFMQEGALSRVAAEYPDVNFIFIDGYPSAWTMSPVSPSRKSRPVIWLAMPLSRKAMRSSASPAAAAAPTPLAAVTATASFRAPMTLRRKWIRPSRSTTPGSTALPSPLLPSFRP